MTALRLLCRACGTGGFMEALLECRGLTKRYGSKRGVNDVNLILGRGRIVGLLGPNGSGKTTLIKLICGLLSPTSGELLINGKKIGVESKLSVAYLPDVTYLNESMKVKNILDYFEDFYSNFNMHRAIDMLEALHIDPNERLKTMSKGTKEKVQLILVMSRDAELYVLDEPIGGVDPAARDYILNTILGNYNKNASIIISTHLISDIEQILDDAIIIKEGKIIEVSSTKAIREKYGCSVNDMFREVFRC